MMHILASLFSLSLAATPVLIVFYLVYKLLLSSDSRFRLNRMLLAVVPPLSFGVLPLARYISKLLASEPSGAVRVVSATSVQSAEWILWIYLGGMVVVAVMTVAIYVRIAMIVRSGKKLPCEKYVLIVSVRKDIVSFSWLRYIVIPAADYRRNGEVIMIHEQCHLRNHHWLDLLVAQIVIIINWFNPAAWLLREELKSVHEFEADRGVLASGADARAYQMLLVEKAMGSRFPSIANSLNHSSLKRRIDMMVARSNPRGFALRISGVILSAMAALTILFTPKAEAYLSTVEMMGKRPVTVHPSLDGVEVYVNGKAVTYEKMNDLNPKNIKSITVNKSDPERSLILIDYEDK